MSGLKNSGIPLRDLSFIIFYFFCFFGIIQKQVIAKDDFIDLLVKIQKRSYHTVDSLKSLESTLWKYYHQPLNINQASYQKIAALQILTKQQLRALWQHIQIQGPLLSVYELQSIPYFDLETIQIFLPFIKIPTIDYHFSQHAWHQRMVGKNSTLQVCYDHIFERARGYQLAKHKNSTHYFLGSPDKLSVKFHLYNPHDFSIGFSGRKNDGEKIFWYPAKRYYGYANSTFHMGVYEKKYLKTLVLGDYQVSYGQGLIHYGGFSLNKSTEAIRVIRTNNFGLKPQKNANRDYTLRGIGTTFRKDHWEMTTYYGCQYLDGAIQQNQKTSQNATFLDHYKTPARIQNKATIKEQVIGSILMYHNSIKKYNFGYSALYQWYPVYIQPKEYLYNRYHFRGKENYNHGLFYQFFWDNLHFFGEVGISKSKGKGLLAGIVTSIWPTLEGTVLLHHYDKNFHNLYGKAFGVNTHNQNEIGIYTGIQWHITKQCIVNAYYDFYYFPWYKYGVDKRLTYSNDGRIHTKYLFSRQVFTTLQYRLKTKAKNLPSKNKKISQQASIAYQKNHTLFWQLQYALLAHWHGKIQAQYTQYHFDRQYQWGYALVKDFSHKKRKLKIGSRVAFFNTQGYNTRLYFYEPYAPGPPGFYRDKGFHYFLYGKYALMPSCKLTCKIGQIRYIGYSPLQAKKTLDHISGNTKTNIILQLHYRF